MEKLCSIKGSKLYFNGEEFSEDEIRQALRVNVADGKL